MGDGASRKRGQAGRARGPEAAPNPARLYLAALGEGSRPSTRSALEKIAFVLSGGRASVEDFPWADVRHEHTQALRTGLVESLAPRTVNRHLSALRGVLREAWRLGLIDAEAFHRAVDIEGVRCERPPAGRDVSLAERKELLRACAADRFPVRGARDAAMLALLCGTGMRRSEVVALDLADVALADGSVRVFGKGNKERVVHLVAGAQAALELWLAHRGREAGPLLCRIARGGHVRRLRLSPQAVRLVLQRRLEETGIARATPHDFRRTLCGDLLDAGADLAAVQSLFGHASPAQTARYDRRGERARRKAAERVKVPFDRAAEER